MNEARKFPNGMQIARFDDDSNLMLTEVLNIINLSSGHISEEGVSVGTFAAMWH